MNKRRLTIIITGIVAAIIIIAVIDYFVPGESPAPSGSPPAEEIEVLAEPVTTTESPSEPSTPTPLSSTQPPLTFEQKIEKLRKVIAEVAASQEPQEATLVFTEAEVNEQAAQRLTPAETSEDTALEMKSIQIDLKPGNSILAAIEADIYGFTGTVKITTEVGTEEGKPAAEVTDVSVPLPGVKEMISELAQQKIEGFLNQLTGPGLVGKEEVDLEYTEITTQEGDITMRLLVKPRA